MYASIKIISSYQKVQEKIPPFIMQLGAIHLANVPQQTTHSTTNSYPNPSIF